MENNFSQSKIAFLDYVVTNKVGTEYDEGRGNPRGEVVLTQKWLRSFVGLANYYHHFILDFSKVVRTLFNLKKMAIPIVG